MRSVLMQLRKCCNHAFLLDGVEEEHTIQVCSHLMRLGCCSGAKQAHRIRSVHCMCSRSVPFHIACHCIRKTKGKVTGLA